MGAPIFLMFIKTLAPFIQEPTPALEAKSHPHIASGFLYARLTPRYLTHNSNHPNGGVRGGTIRLLPVDSKAEAKRSRLLSS